MKDLSHKIIRHPFFRDMKPDHLEILARRAEEVEFAPGDVLFREGEPANRFFLIESGRVALEADVPHDGVLHVQDICAGEVLGWSWLFPPFSWHFQVRAVEPTKVIALNGAHLLVASEENNEFGYQLMKRIAQVVIGRMRSARQRMLALHAEAAHTAVSHHD